MTYDVGPVQTAEETVKVVWEQLISFWASDPLRSNPILHYTAHN